MFEKTKKNDKEAGVGSLKKVSTGICSSFEYIAKTTNRFI